MNKRLYKFDIVKRVKEKLKEERIPMPTIGIQKRYTQTVIEMVIDAFLDVILEIIEEGNVVALTGYMTIETRLHKDKMVYVCATGEKSLTPAHYQTKVQFGKKFQDACKRLTKSELR